MTNLLTNLVLVAFVHEPTTNWENRGFIRFDTNFPPTPIEEHWGVPATNVWLMFDYEGERGIIFIKQLSMNITTNVNTNVPFATRECRSQMLHSPWGWRYDMVGRTNGL